jgi:hypothetical protein
VKVPFQITRVNWRELDDNLLGLLEKKIDVIFAGDCLYEPVRS